MRGMWQSLSLSLLLVLLSLFLSVYSFKPEDFKLCKDASFCRRNRALAPHECAIVGVAGTVQQIGSRITGNLVDKRAMSKKIKYEITTYANGVFRLQIREMETKRAHYEVQDVLVEDIEKGEAKAQYVPNDNGFTLTMGEHSLEVVFEPFFKATQLFRGDPTIVLNERGLLNIEYYREKTEGEPGLEPGAVAPRSVALDTNDLWEETFKGHRDTKPYGPESIGLDATFVDALHVYGLPERATSMSLKPTKGEGAMEDADPYRLYNLDVFEYDVSNPKHNVAPLYGAIPVMHAIDAKKSSALLWLNAAETYIDVETLPNGKGSHWFSEAGIVDVFLMAGDSAADVQKQYAALTGPPLMPPLFSIAYHQCRWNYKDEQDVLAVDGGFDEHDIPYDVLWLDIEHTDGKKYFTWDKSLFPDPVRMQHALAEKGRKVVTIIDPHIKSDGGYSVSSEGKAGGHFCTKADGGIYDGHCWPGTSNWLDFSRAEVRAFWAEKFASYDGLTDHLFTWNDMNEPSVFNGPEITMSKDVLHGDGREHREIHNMYGFLMTWATMQGQLKARPNLRPFILTRSIFAGSQRHAAIWTGDNMAKWEHLAAAQPMLLSLSLSGMPFCGADVGGFFYDPEPELLVRWYQAAAFHPFFRGHAHIDTKRREPWLFGGEVTKQIRDAIRVRYSILPYLYTLFYDAHTTGVSIMRAMYMEFPRMTELFGMDDQFLLGSALLVKPVVTANTQSLTVYLPSSEIWYNFYTGVRSPSTGEVSVPTPADRIAVFQKAGTILPQRMRPRRSSGTMKNDPFTLTVAPRDGIASGSLYLDDGATFDYQKGVYIHRSLHYANGKLTSKAVPSASNAIPFSSPARIERIVLLGQTAAPSAVSVAGQSLEFEYDAQAQKVTIRKPWMLVTDDWVVEIA